MKPVLLGVGLVSALFAAPTFSQEETKRPGAQPPSRIEAGIERQPASAQPGPEHRRLEAFVGTWDFTGQCWAKGSPESVTGTARSEWVLGNRFVKTHINGTQAGQAFEGMGLCGYDNDQRRFVSNWADTMSTAIQSETGTYDPATKTFTYMGSFKDEKGTTVQGRRTIKITSDSEHVMTAYKTDPGQGETKVLELTMKRSSARAEAPKENPNP